jgi:hypothetical protein
MIAKDVKKRTCLSLGFSNAGVNAKMGIKKLITMRRGFWYADAQIK